MSVCDTQSLFGKILVVMAHQDDETGCGILIQRARETQVQTARHLLHTFGLAVVLVLRMQSKDVMHNSSFGAAIAENGCGNLACRQEKTMRARAVFTDEFSTFSFSDYNFRGIARPNVLVKTGTSSNFSEGPAYLFRRLRFVSRGRRIFVLQTS